MSRLEPQVVTPHLLRGWPLPPLQADKESRGRVLVVGGSRDNPGGVLLAAEAALRVGAGKVQVLTARSTSAAMGVALPEAMVRGVEETEEGHLGLAALEQVLELARECEAVLVGPGMGDVESARSLTSHVVRAVEVPVVLDALALACVTEDAQCLAHLDGRAVLTPNLNELAHTLGWDADRVEADPGLATVALAERTGTAVSSGGSVTWTAHPDGRTWQGAVGGPGLGTSGSGDVKAGIIAGLVARGAEAAQACVWGSHLHGSAGDRLTAELGPAGFLARELARQVPAVLAELNA